MREIVGVLSALVLVTACQTTQPPPVTGENVGEYYTDVFPVNSLGMSAPLPDGKWKLVAYDKTANNLNIEHANYMLAQIENDNVKKLMWTFASLGTSHTGYANWDFCSRKDMLPRISQMG